MSRVETAARVTLSDVAARAGVSEKSVSRVVNNEPHVSEKLRNRVQEAISELNYVPDHAARSLAGTRSYTISIVLSSQGAPYAIKLIEGAYEACREAQYHLQIEDVDSTQPTAVLISQFEQILLNGRVDGMILSPPCSDNPAIMDLLETRGVPYSRISPFLDISRAPRVYIDEEKAAADIADMFLEMGHRHIGMVTGLMEHGSAVARRKGFIERIARAAPDIAVQEASGNYRFLESIDAGRTLLEGENRPTAIFAANDVSAAGVMSACAQLGLSVPADVSICGFDDSWMAQSVWPFLTTMYQPIAEMASRAAKLLIHSNSMDPGEGEVLLGHRLVMRDSMRQLG